LTIRAVTLPGSATGILYYITPNLSALLDAEVWIAAFSQIFFTLSVSMGVMIAYASYQKKKADVTKNAVITALANSGISILAGFAVFGTLGYMVIDDFPLMDAIYQTGITFTTVGFGEISPISHAGRIFTITLIIFGFIIFSIAVGIIAEVIKKGEFQKISKDIYCGTLLL
jgi:SNF family Na+-dependent transporter